MCSIYLAYYIECISMKWDHFIVGHVSNRMYTARLLLVYGVSIESLVRTVRNATRSFLGNTI